MGRDSECSYASPDSRDPRLCRDTLPCFPVLSKIKNSVHSVPLRSVLNKSTQRPIVMDFRLCGKFVVFLGKRAIIFGGYCYNSSIMEEGKADGQKN